MSKEGTLITLGVLVAISPFLGLPLSWLSFFLPVMGTITLFIGYLIRRDHVASHTRLQTVQDTPSFDTSAPSPIA